jgi:hypothetical protein
MVPDYRVYVVRYRDFVFTNLTLDLRMVRVKQQMIRECRTGAAINSCVQRSLQAVTQG